MIKAMSVLHPHPNLLPQGEGTAVSLQQAFAEELPLPEGEGSGEDRF